MGLSGTILCLDGLFTGFSSHKETHSRKLFKYCTVDTDKEREKEKQEREIGRKMSMSSNRALS